MLYRVAPQTKVVPKQRLLLDGNERTSLSGDACKAITNFRFGL